jgi:putative lipoprotein
MRTIKGTIVSNKAGRPFESTTTARVQVIDCSLACAPSRTLGEVVLRDLKNFPLGFEVNFDDEEKDEDRPIVEVAIQVRIETGERLDYINDTQFSIKNHSTGEFKDSIDIHIIPVGN